ncbi:hypothetical protein SMC3_01135 [Candidatus Cryosericum hinesii]|uniref:Phospholipase n=3 Tax=Candidatus Cryosericum hinesii TaxID=2290915 RepID=A0A398DGN8_9BACT|nr:hypothetical protein SMC4_00940 [Candidatus Cryosericum hinesii]RIE14836.1 hypothetical protein SMC3_01135 [Candidatus Cryosericum hinesii]
MRMTETLDKGGAMKRNRKLLCAALVVAFALFCLVSPVDAWNSHGACTKLIISDQEWLKAYDSITVTPWTYQDVDTAAVGPNFVLQYIEGKPGTVTSAAAILTNYADEPDWKMDEDLQLSPLQALTGGSQGWRHQYYGLGWLRFGVAPSRAQYFFDLAGKAREKGDLYWTFRYLARAMHYVQDTTQPYHGVPAPVGIIFKGIGNFGTLMGSATNHHYNLEEYQGAMVARNSPVFVTALQNALPLDIATATSPSWLCRHAAYLGRPVVRELWPLETKFFGDSINGKDSWFFDESTLHAADPGTTQAAYDQEISTPLGRMSSYTKTLFLLARAAYGL